MFVYEKKLQYPVRIANPNPQLAAVIISQYGGPDGELGASLRYLSQRYSMPYPELKGLLTDIGTEELGHLEMVGTIVHQLTRTLTQEQIESAGFANYFVDHTAGVYPQAASGTPWSAATMAVTGDPIADLTEDLAAEQKARVTYDNILRISDDPDVNDAIRFLREREIVHFQRFGEAVELLRQRLDEKNVYYMNPALHLQAQTRPAHRIPAPPTPVHFCKAAHTGRPDAISSGLPQNTTALPEDCVSFRAVTLHYMGKGHRYLHTGTLGGWQYYLGTSCFHLQRRMHKPNFRFPRSA